MNSIDELTKKLFTVNYEKDFDNDDTYYKYLSIANELIQNEEWLLIYKSWYNYLICYCKDEASTLNFAHLFWNYQGQKHYIPNAIEFVSYFYSMISFDNYPDADYLLDGITSEVFKNSGIKTQEELYDYIPLNDSIIIDEIKKWREKV